MSENPVEKCPACGQLSVGDPGKGGWNGVPPRGWVPKDARSLALFQVRELRGRMGNKTGSRREGFELKRPSLGLINGDSYGSAR